MGTRNDAGDTAQDPHFGQDATQPPRDTHGSPAGEISQFGVDAETMDEYESPYRAQEEEEDKDFGQDATQPPRDTHDSPAGEISNVGGDIINPFKDDDSDAPSKDKGTNPASSVSDLGRGISSSLDPSSQPATMSPLPAPAQKPMGSIYVNGASYSGVDIKVLVNTYNPFGPNGVYTSMRNENRKKLEASLAQMQVELGSKYSLQSLYKQHTREYNKTTQEIKRLNEKMRQIKSALNAMSRAKQSTSGGSKVLTELQTLSISTHRDKNEVRAFGHVYSKGVVRGPRTVAGSMVFTVFNSHVLQELMELHSSEFDQGIVTTTIADQIPPMDLTIVFANEYGNISRMAIYGVEIVNEGMVMSIEDLFTESTINFIARDFDPIRGVEDRTFNADHIMQTKFGAKWASDLLLEEDQWKDKSRLNPFYRFITRSNPFI